MQKERFKEITNAKKADIVAMVNSGWLSLTPSKKNAQTPIEFLIHNPGKSKTTKNRQFSATDFYNKITKNLSSTGKLYGKENFLTGGKAPKVVLPSMDITTGKGKGKGQKVSLVENLRIYD